MGATLLRSRKSSCVGVTNAFVGLTRNLQAAIIEPLGPFHKPPSSGHGRSRGEPRLKQHNRGRRRDLFSFCGLEVKVDVPLAHI